MGLKLLVVGFLLSSALAGTAFGGAAGSSSQTIPGGPSAAAASAVQECRSFPTAASIATTSGRFSSNLAQACSYSASTNEITCSYKYSDSMGCNSTSVAVAKYLSAADIVDEAKVVPPLYLLTGVSITATGSCGPQPSSVAYFYDDQRRLTRFAVKWASGSQTTSYTAWDKAGRPTTGMVTGLGPAIVNSLTYDDTGRTMTLTTGSQGIMSVITTTYDANGNTLLSVARTAGLAAGTRTVTTITATDKVCK
jgi:hypothetical protein